MDIFDNTILCKDCKKEMEPSKIEKSGFILRIVKCPKCNSIIVHPNDEVEYRNFIKLKNKTFRVKMRIVGNSYAVSIPKEIVHFIRVQERMIDDMVRLCFNDARKLSLMFGDENER